MLAATQSEPEQKSAPELVSRIARKESSVGCRLESLDDPPDRGDVQRALALRAIDDDAQQAVIDFDEYTVVGAIAHCCLPV